MIRGIGIDMIEIDRVKKAAQSERFLQKVFTPNEIAYCKERGKHQYASLAARFAAKEAVIKALNIGNQGIFWQQIEVVRIRDEAPQILLSGKVREIAGNKGVSTIFLSLSHHQTEAIAQVILC
jgi:holo-[acyl-carrier-protein] synthase